MSLPSFRLPLRTRIRPSSCLLRLPRAPLPLSYSCSYAYSTSPPSQPPSTPSTSPPLTDALRTTFRHLPHPVAILTAPQSRGITLSTLTCLSLHPQPLLTFNIKIPSSCSSSLHSHPNIPFCLHILASSPHTVHLANSFAQLGAGAPGGPGKQKFSPWGEARQVETRGEGEGEVKVLGREDGVMRRIWCTKERVVEVGDHEIWVGRVEEVEEVGAWGEEGKGGEWALVYGNRKFRSVGGEVRPEKGVMGEVMVGDQEDEP